jgi:PqqD family protein of HPr-rel-A system
VLDLIRRDVTALYERYPSLRVEPVGDGWAAFSPRSGETLLLNDEAAALLEILADGPASLHQICEFLSRDAGVPASDIRSRVNESWDQFVRAGLVARVENDRRGS